MKPLYEIGQILASDDMSIMGEIISISMTETSTHYTVKANGEYEDLAEVEAILLLPQTDTISPTASYGTEKIK